MGEHSCSSHKHQGTVIVNLYLIFVAISIRVADYSTDRMRSVSAYAELSKLIIWENISGPHPSSDFF